MRDIAELLIVGLTALTAIAGVTACNSSPPVTVTVRNSAGLNQTNFDTEGPPDDFMVMYHRKIPGEPFTFYAATALGAEPERDFGEAALAGTEMSCGAGCILGPDGGLMAVGAGLLTPAGTSVRVGALDGCDGFQGVGGFELTAASHVELTRQGVYFSSGDDTKFRIHRLDPDTGKVDENVVPLLGQVSGSRRAYAYKGRFTASPSGRFILLAHPTLASVDYRLWDAERGLQPLQSACAGWNDFCWGTGSLFTDDPPAAFSPDERLLVVAAPNPELMLQLFSTDRSEPDSGIVVTPGDWTRRCETRPAGHPVEILPSPAFDPAGEFIYFAGAAQCDKERSKADTAIYRVSIDRVRLGGALEAGELEVLYSSPPIDTPRNIEIASMVLSPDGRTVAFAGTPRFGPSGNELGVGAPVGSLRELYTLSVKDRTLAQRTNGGASRIVSDLVTMPRPPAWTCHGTLFGLLRSQ